MPSFDLNEVREVRSNNPVAVLEAAKARKRPSALPEDGRLMIVAADHTARGAYGVRGDKMAMADRNELLRRLAACLEHPGVDGLLGTPDIVEDLLLMGYLENKRVYCSMNRGGLMGSTFEMDDRFTAYNTEAIVAGGYEGGKMLVRIDLNDPGTVETLEACGRAVTELANNELVAMVEPFISNRVDGRIVNDLSADAVIRSMGIASGLGATSAYTWLKLPVVDEMERVMTATTMPTLLLGGDPQIAPDETYAKWEKAAALPGVLGLVVGRALLYPPDHDVTSAVDTAVRIVHK